MVEEKVHTLGLGTFLEIHETPQAEFNRIISNEKYSKLNLFLLNNAIRIGEFYYKPKIKFPKDEDIRYNFYQMNNCTIKYHSKLKDLSTFEISLEIFSSDPNFAKNTLEKILKEVCIK